MIENFENVLHNDDDNFLFYLKYPLTNRIVSKLLVGKKIV